MIDKAKPSFVLRELAAGYGAAAVAAEEAAKIHDRRAESMATLPAVVSIAEKGAANKRLERDQHRLREEALIAGARLLEEQGQ